MMINGQYINLSKINSVVPIGNMDKCRVTFTSGITEVVSGYQRIMKELNQGDSNNEWIK